MAYRLDFGKPLEAEVRRIAGEQLDAARNLLQHQPDGLHEAVHDARRHIKRTRALLRLVRSGDRHFVDQANGQLRDVAHSLAHLREASTLVESATRLLLSVEGREPEKAIVVLIEQLDTRREQLTDADAGLQARIAAADAALADLVSGLGALDLPAKRKKRAKVLAKGWQRVTEKARSALAGCEEMQASQPFHELRKRSQDRWMHASLLRHVWPAAMISVQRQTKELVDILGQACDLDVLAHHLASDEAVVSGEEKETILLAIDEQRRRLCQAAIEAAPDLYDKRPGRDAGALRALVSRL